MTVYNSTATPVAASMTTSSYPMSIPSYVLTCMAPSLIFAILALPVKRKNILQEAFLTLLWFTGLCIPIYYAGQYPYICLMSTSVWAWATSMKMGVWVFCTSIEQRRKRPFINTLTQWRHRTTPPSPSFTSIKPDEYIQLPIWYYFMCMIKHQLLFDLLDCLYSLFNDSKRPIVVFSALASKAYGMLGFTEKAAALASAEPLTLSYVLVSVLMCNLFCVYIQMQLQVIYDTFLLIYSIVYRILPWLEKWQLSNNGEKKKKNHPQQRQQKRVDAESTRRTITKNKTILKRVRGIRTVKSWIEDTMSMQPAFDCPWIAYSLRDFWGRRWHTFYNDCFYQLGYRPIRAAVQLLFHCKTPRWLPALSVFVMSGLMHEFFLYAATGSTLYFNSTLPACGLQFTFFVLQAVLVSLGDVCFSGGPIGIVYTYFCMSLTSHFFAVPYILTGYQYMERFSFYRIAMNLYNQNPDVFAAIIQ